jgi:3-deoxy-manno-octulosonate cytidylyltransferase (CMP-KDO synthetase)
MADSDILIVIPARMASTRLPGKPLAEIAGEPMIVHVLRRAQAANVGEVVVATDSEAIAACVEKAGGRAVMTRAGPIARDHGRPALMRLRALYFTRATAPAGEGPLYHHIGLYAFRRPALVRFVSLPPSPLEQREKLEQLRALEAGMRIDVTIVDSVPLGVDTPDDLERACALLASGRSGSAR